MDAYQAFLKKRMGDQGGEGDQVSIVLFNSTAQIVGPIIQPIEAAPNYIDLRGGGIFAYLGNTLKNCFSFTTLQ